MSMERFSVVHQSANEPNFAFFRGERDLLGQGRGLEGEGAGVSSFLRRMLARTICP